MQFNKNYNLIFETNTTSINIPESFYKFCGFLKDYINLYYCEEENELMEEARQIKLENISAANLELIFEFLEKFKKVSPLKYAAISSTVKDYEVNLKKNYLIIFIISLNCALV